jgi:hypothetical protein
VFEGGYDEGYATQNDADHFYPSHRSKG